MSDLKKRIAHAAKMAKKDIAANRIERESNKRTREPMGCMMLFFVIVAALLFFTVGIPIIMFLLAAAGIASA